MKQLAAPWFLSLFVAGCVSPRTHQDSFASLQILVKQRLASRWDCTSVSTNEVASGRMFEVPSPRSACRILVFEREFMTQKEWEKRYSSATNLLDQFMVRTNYQIDSQSVQQFAGI